MKDTLKRLIAALLCVLMLNGTLLPSLAVELPEAEPDDETVQETDAPEVLPDEEREPSQDGEAPSDLPDDTAGSPDWTDTPDPVESDALPGEDDTVEILTDITEETVSAPGGENDALFYDYMVQAARENMTSVSVRKARYAPADNLDENTRYVYSKLVPLIQEVARGARESTMFTLEDLGIPTVWTKEDLGVERLLYIDENGNTAIDPDASAAMNAALAIQLKPLNHVLLASHPYHLYWYDKTAGISKAAFRFSYTSKTVTIKPPKEFPDDYPLYFILMPVAREYSAQDTTGAYTINTALAQAAALSAETAAGVVDDCAGLGDYDRLVAYRDYICDNVSYNWDDYRAHQNGTRAYGNPWQLIWVFDGDTDTNVVCEGYAKAFQYLCDLTVFNQPVECRLISGSTTGGHMWNVVGMPDGRNYLVDVTNYDSTRGACYFLGGYSSGSVGSSYTYRYTDKYGSSHSLTYTYDGDMFTIFTEDELTISSTPYTPPSVELVVSAQDSNGIVLGDVDVNPSGTLCSGNSVTLTAPALWSWAFQGWYEGSTVVSTDRVYTFVIHGNTELIARYQQENAAVTVHGEAGYSVNDNAQVFTGTQEISTPVGGQITLTAADSSLFLRWEDENGRVLGTERVLTCTVNNDMDITLVSRSANATQVTFRTDYGQVLRSDSLRPDDTIAFPTPPTKAGYDFTGWVFADSGSPASVAGIRRRLGTDSQIDLLPAFAPRSDTCTVVVDADGTETAFDGLSIGSAQSFTAPEMAGKTFLKWTDGEGHVLGCEQTLYLMVTGDTTLRAVYGSAPQDVSPAVTLSPLWLTTVGSTRKISGSANRNVPDGYTVLETGMLYTVNRELDEDRFVLGGSGVSRYAGAGTDNHGALFLNVKVARWSTVISMRGYVLLRENATGRTAYWYSGIRSACVNDLITA